MIEIWSKPQCPFCDKAENLCKQKNFEYKKYMLDTDFTREQMFEKFPSARTFPQITVNGELIGGYTEFAAKVSSEE
jgi:glutaredoxin